MASAPAPSASISANGSFCAPSRTRPLDPTQIAPDFSTTGNNAAAKPPVMGSLTVARDTRLEMTPRFTGCPLLVTLVYKRLFIIMVPGHHSTRLKPNSGGRGGTHEEP